MVGIEYSHQEEIEVGHHRIEKREVYSVLVTELPPLHNQNKWLELKTVIMVVSERILWNKTTYDVRFYISSIESNAELFMKSIRGHWGIENSLHWSLDVTFSEDKSRIRKDNAPENFALLRKLALNLLNQEKSNKDSNKMKRYRAAMDNNYLVKILKSSSQSNN